MVQCNFCKKEMTGICTIRGEEVYHTDCLQKQILKEGLSKGYDVCPLCNGTSLEKYEVDTYPPGLPDSGWVCRMQVKEKTCTMCSGKGYV